MKKEDSKEYYRPLFKQLELLVQFLDNKVELTEAQKGIFRTVLTIRD